MARIDVPMPQMGESIAEGTVSVWLKKVGDPVERDEPIMEISTDKVDAEIPSPAAGVLARIIVNEGETVEVGSTVAYIETEPGAVSTEAPPSADADSASETGASQDDATGGSEAPSGGAGNGWAREATSGEPETAEERLRRRSTPLVRRIAAEHGVTLGEIEGTGRAGRVTKTDILQFVAEGGRSGRSGGAGGSPIQGYHAHVEHPLVDSRPGDRVEPMSRMTSLIAEHMVLSRRISAHVHTYVEVDFSRVDQVRIREKASWAEKGVKVTYTAFIAKAVARALREHPIVNAAVSGNRIVYRGEVNLGVAVALERGLIVPVIPRADELSLTGIARAIVDLAERARSKRLSPEEVQGGTFTITNPGMFGAVLGFPIINQPQVAIMAVGSVEKRPVVVTDEFGNDGIVARRRGFISLGFDHRIVNGADADIFMARVKEILEKLPDGG